MNFTYNSYKKLVQLLKKNDYTFCNYYNYPRNERCVIMRHDIDYDINQSVCLAELERDLGIKSTFFVLLSSDFYNPASAQSYNQLRQIIKQGHSIGLHFDETAYEYREYNIEYYIRKEARILSELLDVNINTFSLHRPNKVTIETELEIPGMINSYGTEFFNGFKYLSDSRRCWREPVESIIELKAFKKLHILTHAFWYHGDNVSLEETICRFIDVAKDERVKNMDSNISNLKEIVGERYEKR